MNVVLSEHVLQEYNQYACDYMQKHPVSMWTV
jgi:hypothetical protein